MTDRAYCPKRWALQTLTGSYQNHTFSKKRILTWCYRKPFLNGTKKSRASSLPARFLRSPSQEWRESRDALMSVKRRKLWQECKFSNTLHFTTSIWAIKLLFREPLIKKFRPSHWKRAHGLLLASNPAREHLSFYHTGCQKPVSTRWYTLTQY